MNPKIIKIRNGQITIKEYTLQTEVEIRQKKGNKIVISTVWITEE